MIRVTLYETYTQNGTTISHEREVWEITSPPPEFLPSEAGYEPGQKPKQVQGSAWNPVANSDFFRVTPEEYKDGSESLRRIHIEAIGRIE